MMCMVKRVADWGTDYRTMVHGICRDLGLPCVCYGAWVLGSRLARQRVGAVSKSVERYELPFTRGRAARLRTPTSNRLHGSYRRLSGAFSILHSLSAARMNHDAAPADSDTEYSPYCSIGVSRSSRG